MSKNELINEVVMNKKQVGVALSDIVNLDEMKKMLKIFSDSYDDFMQRMAVSAVRVVERMTNGQIIAEKKEITMNVNIGNDFHAIIELPDRPVLEVNRITSGRNVIKDYTLVEKHGKFCVIIPFFSTLKKDKVSIKYTVGMAKENLSENLKDAVSLVFKNLFEGKDFKVDNLAKLKMLLAGEIFYNI